MKPSRWSLGIAVFVMGAGLWRCGGSTSGGTTSGGGGSAGASSGSGGNATGGDDTDGSTCEVDGQTYEEGASFPASDGCNTCTCLGGGGVVCTQIACPGETPCGGWRGDTCNEDEYCAYEPGQHCGAADATSVCRPRPTGCDFSYVPVCGCDGQTYGNACAANAAGHGVKSDGECP